jgi:membrane protein
MRERARALVDPCALRLGEEVPKWHRFIHFWVLVWRSFVGNRCPVRASALAYATLLALIPMLAVAMSVTSSFLKKQGEEKIYQFIGQLVASVTTSVPIGPEGTGTSHNAGLEPTNAPAADGNAGETNTAPKGTLRAEGAGSLTHTNGLALAARPEKQNALDDRRAVAHNINRFIQNTQSGALGITGSVLLIFVAISMLSRIETTFNDIWGVARGRSWFMRIVLYWGVLSLAPLLLILVLGLATGPHLETTKRFVATLPVVGNFLFDFGFHLLPVIVLCLSFAAFYILMPNTRVDWRAALAGGLIGGVLFHLNNVVSVLYVSRVVSNSRIYGSLGLVPVFMIGLYFSWLILLFGAQVAYAFENRNAYLEQRQIETINQRGREFIALRVMTLVGSRFLRGEPAADVLEVGEELNVPTRLIQQIMQTLAAARLVVETAGCEAYVPARPIENITCHDILLALRASQGQELATRDEPSRAEVYGEFERIQEAERQAASSVTMLALVNRAQARLQLGRGERGERGNGFMD